MRTHTSEPFVVNREVCAVVVPAGTEIKLQPGQAGYITQALGGSFTVYLEGNLFRIAGEDADAIGKEPVKAPELPPNATEEDVRYWLQGNLCRCTGYTKIFEAVLDAARGAAGASK